MAKVLWCWRCGREVPMLEDDEWAVLVEAHRASSNPERAMAIIEREQRRRGLPPVLPLPADASPVQRRLRHLTAGYELFTGVPESNPNAVWHHVVSQHGPPCAACGKPLRSPRAETCAVCGAPAAPRDPVQRAR
jgi:hypothetical protein